MRAREPRPLSSGDIIADRRHALAEAYRGDGDLAAAADLFAQAAEIAPQWAASWFALGETRLALGDEVGAVEAFSRARDCDPDDELGAGLRLARLGAADSGCAMSGGYIATLFDQYAAEFDETLVDRLAYRGPALIADAVSRLRPARFARALDLGCGTGLMGAAVRARVDALVGVDLSRRMLALARAKSIYDDLRHADMLAALRTEANGGVDLLVAADALIYVGDLGATFAEAARVLAPGGLFAFSLEAGEAMEVEIGPSLRYRHSVAHVKGRAAAAGLAVASLSRDWTRIEAGQHVDSLIAVLSAA